MNKTFTYILISGASALAGGIAGYIFCKKKMQNKFDEAVADAVDKELKVIKKVREELNAVPLVGYHSSNDPEQENNTVDEKKVDNVDIYQMVYDEFTVQAAANGVDLNPYRVSMLTACLRGCREKGFDADKTQEAIEKMLAECEELEEESEGDDDYNPMDDFDNEPPHVLPLSDYRELPPIFEFVTYHYFEDDDVLIDDGDEVVDNIDDTVGDALVHFDEEEDDGDCVYVVNGQMGLAIEIVRLHSSYSGWNGWGG